MRHSSAWAWHTALLGTLAVACSVSTTQNGEGGSGGAGAGGASAQGDGGTSGIQPSKDILLAVTASDQGTTAGIYDGKTWKMHAFPGELAAWPAPQVALAPDGTGIIVKGTGREKSLRFARYLGDDKWSAFSDVPDSQVSGSGLVHDEAGPVSLIYRNGVFVLAHNSIGYHPVVRTFDPVKGTFSSTVTLTSGTMKCETAEGVQRDCAMADGIRLKPSATGPDEVFAVFDGGLGGFYTSFNPLGLASTAPVLKAAPGDVRTSQVPDSAPMVNEGESRAAQIYFGIADRFEEHLNFVGEQVSLGEAGYCYRYYKVLVTPSSADVSILCKGPQWNWQYDSWEHLLEGHLSGNKLAFKTVPTSLPPLGSFEYVRGVGTDKPYVLGVMDGLQVALFKDMNGPPGVFAKGSTIAAVATPR